MSDFSPERERRSNVSASSVKKRKGRGFVGDERPSGHDSGSDRSRSRERRKHKRKHRSKKKHRDGSPYSSEDDSKRSRRSKRDNRRSRSARRSRSPSRSRSPRSHSRSRPRRRRYAKTREQTRSRSPSFSRTRRISRFDKPDGYQGAGGRQRRRKSGWDAAPATRTSTSTAVSAMGDVSRILGGGVPGFAAPTTAAVDTTKAQVSAFPAGTSEDMIKDFFVQEISATSLVKSAADPIVLRTSLDDSGAVATVEFATPDMASTAMNLDGLPINGCGVRIRRTPQYVAAPGVFVTGREAEVNPHLVAENVFDGPDKIYVGGLPLEMSRRQAIELVSPFGPIASCHMVVDPLSHMSKGFAFFEFVDHANTDFCCETLNGVRVGGKTLIVQRANAAAGPAPGDASYDRKQAEADTAIIDAIANAATTKLGIASVTAEIPFFNPRPTRVLRMLNMVTDEHFVPGEYEDVLVDVRQECSKFGKVVSVKIPRPIGVGAFGSAVEGSQAVPGVGKVFVEFSNAREAGIAQQQLTGLSFSNRTIVTSFHDHDAYLAGNLF